MSLDPSASPWPGVLASVGVCLWMAAIGVPLAAAAFRHRPRLVWPFYAPILGAVTVLLVTNLAAYAIPGAPAAWFGLIAPSVAAAVVAWRLGPPRHPSRRSVLILLALVLLGVGVFLLAFTNRTHSPFADESWHYPLALRLAKGVFPPEPPYGIDAGIGYHYGTNLLAASIFSTTSAPPWAVFDTLLPFLVMALALVAAGFAYDVGAPAPLAFGVGATAAVLPGRLLLGLPPYVGVPEELTGFEGFVSGLGVRDVAADTGPSWPWIIGSHRHFALAVVFLVAAALEANVARRPAMVLAAGAGVLALTETSVMLFACGALALVGTARLVRLRGRKRYMLAAALVVSALLVVLAGGSISDALLGRGGTAGWAYLAWEPGRISVSPFYVAGPLLVGVGTVALVVVGGLAAFRRRSWSLGYLAAAAAFGLLGAAVVHSGVRWNDGRFADLAASVAMIGALAGAGALIGRWPASRRVPAALVVGLFAVMPTSLPGVIVAVQQAFSDPPRTTVTVRDARAPSLAYTRFSSDLALNWDFYDWLAQALPADARLLTPYPAVAASLAGVSAPTSGRSLQVLSVQDSPVYEDALRFLHRGDLADMDITHLHVTDRLEAAWPPDARRLLSDSAHFTLVADRRSVSGMRHRLYAVAAGAGTTVAAPASYRFLRQLVPSDAPLSLLGGLTPYHRKMLLMAFADHPDLQTVPTSIDRASRFPRGVPLRPVADRGVVVLPATVEPIALGLSRPEAIWTGYELRAYNLATAAWSPVGRVGPRPAPLPDPLRSVCDAAANGQIDLRVLGEPGTVLAAGPATLTLTGLPQILTLTVPDCRALTLSAPAALAPFVQLRPHHPAASATQEAPIAALAFDGGVVGQRAVLNLWYRNPRNLTFAAGSEFRLYAAGPLGVSLPSDDPRPRSSLHWWPGPLAHYAPEQNARLEFDARQLTINGDPGAGDTSLTPGQTYLLALTVAGVDPRSGYVEIQHIVPLARVVLSDAGAAYEVFTGIAAIEQRAAGTVDRNTGYYGEIGWNPDRTPR